MLFPDEFQPENTGTDIEQSQKAGYATKDYHSPPREPFLDVEELTKWSSYRAIIAKFVSTLLFLYIIVSTIIGYKSQIAGGDDCGGVGVGVLGIAWAVGGMIFVLVYCTVGVSVDRSNVRFV
ncbi:hypothetical protein C5167_048825 [Papaver somniferum]|uniref:Uncharacterized protein n=1 Tax=Papaver somniferum TaxID=3469 RepID=A0A4Y7KN26_PAPSO|nr:hypothetical protein C5167_048825 [Papaver somniferum]